MDFKILGPLEVRGELGDVTLGGTKPRAVLAVLLLNANEPVSAERLALALWGEDAPAGATKTVQVHVSRLRKALGDGEVVTTTPAGYRLRVGPGELDAERFERLVEQGRRVLAAGQGEEASEILLEAERLWRGPALADLSFEPFAQSEIARLEEQRLAALEARVEADASAGRHAELVAELRGLVAEHPSRERLAGQLMIALYRCGRQTEALEAFQESRRRLADELGVEPGPELRELQEAILNQDPSLDLPAGADELPQALSAAAGAPLIGREAELGWLTERWQHGLNRPGTVIAVTGPPGVGKTRLAAELAVEVHRHGAVVLFVAGSGPASAALRVLGRAREASRATLLVIDDADKAEGDLALALRELTRFIETTPVLAVATAERSDPLANLRPAATLIVEPLGLDAVRAIACLYAPDHDPEGVPAQWLSDASGGVPRRVHDVASLWARREAASRVEAAAGRAKAGRAELRSTEAELAGGVVQLQTAREVVERSEVDAGTVICPFKGLASFQVADAPYFFGRERLVAEVVARLVGARLLGVVGPSGSGKSSLVRAGLLPALANGVLPGSEDWQRVLMRPGEHPVRELRGAAADLDPARRVVIAVDQFEEIFTTCRDEDQRGRFVEDLIRAASGHAESVVVLAVRADFYGRCAAYPELARLLAENQVLVGPMRPVELRRAVVGPAQRVGLQVEPDLADALVRDVEDEPGALPLLSTALLELWQRRDGRRLRFASYEDTGGVHGAVARLAERAFGQLDEAQQRLARRALLRLAEVEPEGGVERRRLPLDQFEADGGEQVTTVIRQLADARLLTVSAGSVEFAHEALLREWPRLRGWIEDDREDFRVHRNLSVAGKEWRRLERDEGALYRGARLAEARDWADRGDPGPTKTEREFLVASLDRQRRERGVRRRRLGIAFGSLAAGLVAIAAVAIVALQQRSDAVRQRNVAISRELALQSGKALAVDPGLASRLALAAFDTAATEQAGTALREATLAFRELAVFPADSLDANAVAVGPGGRQLVTGGTDGRVRVWNVGTRREAAHLAAGHGAVLAARFAPGDERIALGFEDGTVALTDPSLNTLRTVLHERDQRVESVAFSGDGGRLAAALGDGTVRLVTLDGGEPARRLSGHQGPVNAVDFSRDASRVVSAGEDGTVRLWRAAEGGPGQVLFRGDEPETDVDFSPDGSRVMAVGRDRWIRFFDTGTGAAEARVSGEGRELLAGAFSAKGDRFAAAGRDGVTRVWSIDGGPPVAVLRGQRSPIFDLSFGAASDRVFTAGDDGTVRLWDAGRTMVWTLPTLTHNLDFNRDGRLLASSGDDGTVQVWDTTTGRLRTSLPGPDGYTAGKFSPAANDIVIPGQARRLRTWSIAARRAEVEVEAPPGGSFNDAAFDATGRRIVYVDDRGRLVVRERASGREVELRGAPKKVYGAEFTPDGNRVVAVPERDLLVWRVDRPERPESTLKGHRGPVNAIDFNRGGRLVSAGADRTVRVWDLGGGPSVVMRGHADEVTTVVFTGDGSKVLSSSQDGTLRLWDARRNGVLAVLQSELGELYDVELSPDGTIATLGKGEIVRVFACEVCQSVLRVRDLALSRSPAPLTSAERRQFISPES